MVNGKLVSAFGPDLEIDAIGRQLKELRLRQRLTISDLSKQTGVSVSYISKIENGQATPSFDVIKRISDALEMGIEDVIQPGDKPNLTGRKTVTRKGEGVLFTSGQYDYCAHGAELAHKGMCPLEIIVHARDVDDFDHWSKHNGEEFIYVLTGAIEVHTEHYAPFILREGDSSYFDSSMAHVYVSVSEEDARVLSISHDPATAVTTKIGRFMLPNARTAEASEVSAFAGDD